MFFSHDYTRFDPTKDVPPLRGKIIFITGGTAGLGKQSILEFARHEPDQIWFTARDMDKAKLVIEQVKAAAPSVSTTVIEMDLSSFASVKTGARTFLKNCSRLDILMLNAGTMFPPLGVTEDGYEVQFGTNHMGHALLTQLLLPTLTQCAEAPNSDVRIISLASHGYVYLKPNGFDFETLKTRGVKIGATQCYYQSKLANILWARELAKKHPQLTVASVHPGLVRTELGSKIGGISWFLRFIARSMMITSVEDGVKNQLWASVSADVQSGTYYEPIGDAVELTRDGKNDDLAQALWDWTRKEIDEALGKDTTA